MAERRMFAKTIVLSDAFLDMPLSARCLYFTLGMLADDDGFVNSPKSIARQCGATDDDLKILIAKRFILVFDSGVIVIKHWRLNNWLRNDRKTDTVYQAEMATLMLDEHGAYTENNDIYFPRDNRLPTKCQPLANQMPTENSIDENNIVYSKKENEKKESEKHKYGEYNNVLLTDEEYEKLNEEFPDLPDRIQKLSEYIASKGEKYKSHYATIKNWARMDKERNAAKPQPAKPQTPKPQVKPASRSNVDFANASWERLRAEMGLDDADEDNN